MKRVGARLRARANRYVFFHILPLFLAVSPLAEAAKFFKTDFDDTLMRSRDGGGFKTPVRLYQVQNRNNALLQLPIERELIVSSSDLFYLHQFLAQRSDWLGDINHTFQLEDGRKIIPGFYYLDPYQSFYPWYGAHPSGGNYLLDSHTAALARVNAAADSRKALDAVKGPAYPLLQMWLSHEKSARGVGVTTARTHSSKREWPEYFKSLVGDKRFELAYEPNYHLFFGAADEENDRYSRDPGDIGGRKAKRLKEFALDLRKVALSAADEVIGLDGKTKERLHVLVVAEDSQKNIQKIFQELSSVVQTGLVPLKVVFANFGTDAEVLNAARGGFPRYFTITRTGSVREAQPAELLGEFSWITPADVERVMKRMPAQVSVPSLAIPGLKCVSELETDGEDLKSGSSAKSKEEKK